jgi:hypothetical protein
MSKGLSELIVDGKLNGIAIGDNFNAFKKEAGVILLQDQIGDIPALYESEHEGLKYEISCIKEVVVGISLKLDLYLDMLFQIPLKSGHLIEFGFKVDFVDFVKSLNDNGIDWEIDKLDTGEKAVGILMQSKTKLMYSFHKDFFGFYQAVNFSLELYHKLRSK